MVDTPIVDASPQTKIDLYKMEYGTAAARYENIFKAVWQNFSYMSAISGAVLAFGGDHFQINFLWFVVCLPLVFWYWATYEPLNRYGDQAMTRLEGIEKEFNVLCGVKMEHFKEFESRKYHSQLRVRHVVRFFFLPVTLVFLLHAAAVARAWCHGVPLMRDSKVKISIVTIPLEEIQKLKIQQEQKTPDLEPVQTPQGKN